MSVKAMAWAWEYSKAAGNNLLVMLAICDRADDDGCGAWPAIEEIAAKSRVHPRTAQRCIRDLQTLGELGVQTALGPYGTNKYFVPVSPKGRGKIAELSSPSPPGNLPPSPPGNLPPSPPGVAVSPPPWRSCVTPPLAAAPPYPSDTSCTSLSAAAPPIENKERNDNAPFHELAQRARAMLKSDDPPADEQELVERLKKEAALLNIDWNAGRESRPGGPPLVWRVASSEWYKHVHLTHARSVVFAEET